MGITEEYIFCAVNDRDKVQWVQGSSQKTRYFNDMRDLGKDCFCDLHSVKDTEGDIAHFFDVDPNAYCAWGYSLGNGAPGCGKDYCEI